MNELVDENRSVLVVQAQPESLRSMYPSPSLSTPSAHSARLDSANAVLEKPTRVTRPMSGTAHFRMAPWPRGLGRGIVEE